MSNHPNTVTLTEGQRCALQAICRQRKVDALVWKRARAFLLLGDDEDVQNVCRILDIGPTVLTDYGMRWGIEAMFSDFKTRGFGIAQSQIKKTDRLERLILVMALAMYWAVSSGAMDEKRVAQSGIKRGFKNIEDPFVHSSSKGSASYADAS